MAKNIKDVLPHVIGTLMHDHCAAWAKGPQGTISYRFLSKTDAYVILRTAEPGGKRLASARVTLQAPNDDKAWGELKTELQRKGMGSLAEAEHRYVFVPEAALPDAKKAFRGNKITVAPHTPETVGV
ncbi:MAG: hypothetical protein AB7O52_04900 [Planctomycetota bacterium]